MKWSVHPAKNNITKTVLSLIFIAGFLSYIVIFVGVIFGFLGLIIFFASLHSYFFPTKYEINEEELLIKTMFATQRRRLKEFKKVYKGKNGLLLSPFKRKTFLNNFRGVFLLLPHDRAPIENYVEQCIASFDEDLKEESSENV